MDVQKEFTIKLAVLIAFVITLFVIIGIYSIDLFPEEEKTVAPIETGVSTISDFDSPFKEVLRGDTQIANNEAVYLVTLDGIWSELTHRDFIPKGPHLSPFIAWTHANNFIGFRERALASDGIKDMAETGAPEKLVNELKELKGVNLISEYVVGKKIYAPGSHSEQLVVKTTLPFVTVVSMIAPSPDWFVTAQNVNLYENGSWVESKEIATTLYDAGTDSGKEFEGRDEETNPREPITKIKGTPENPLVIFRFVKIK